MTWNEFILNEQKQDYYANGIIPFLQYEYSQYECYPPKNEIFRGIFSIPSPEDVKVVILGQDPYHEPGQANGMAFSVRTECPNPPSLQNIIKEICNEYGVGIEENPPLFHGDLEYLAKQGVLLLNTTLSVRRGQANSHSECGWQIFTDHIIQYLDMLNKPIVFMLWGKYAQSKSYLITGSNAKVLRTSHPSPFSANRGFLGCNHFVQCNEFLKANGLKPIDWLGDSNYVSR